MKIDGIQPHHIYKSFSQKEKEEKTSQQPSAETGNSDRVEISEEASERNEAMQMAKKINTPSADSGRAERLAAIKKQVEDGTYQVSPEKVAGKILGGRFDRQA